MTKSIFLLAVFLGICLYSQAQTYRVTATQSLYGSDSIEITISVQKLTGPDFVIRGGDFGFFADTTALNLAGGRKLSPNSSQPVPDTARFEASSYRPVPQLGYFVNLRVPSFQYGVVGSETIPVTSTPTVIETIRIPITNPNGTSGLAWRLPQMAIVPTGSPVRNIRDQGEFLIVPETLQLSNPCTLAVTATATPGFKTVGYGPQNVSLTSAITGATGPVTYAWSTGATTANTTANPTTATVYSVTATNGTCTATDTATVDVLDVRCGPQQRRVLLCQPLWNGNQIQLCLPQVVVPLFLYFGATLGPCNGAAKYYENDPIYEGNLASLIFPNPAETQTTVLTLGVPDGIGVQHTIMDMQGRTVFQFSGETQQGICVAEQQLPELAAGTYLVQVQVGEQRLTHRLVIQ
jgi:PKD repeat protein